MTIGNSVSKIGQNVFDNCSALKSIIIPNSVTEIGKNAFQGCDALTNVTLGNSVTRIDDRAFYGCSSITNITIPNSVTRIGNSVFNSCSKLESVRIEDGETTLYLGYMNYTYGGKCLFYDCPISSLYIGRNLSYNTSSYYEYSPFYKILTIKYLTIGNSVTQISDYAFYYCDGLENVIIGSSVNNIGKDAFTGCRGTITLYSHNITPPRYLYFSDSQYKNYNVYVPHEALTTYQNDNYWKKFWNLQGFDPTGIESVKSDAINGQNVYYDLNGSHLDAPKKGLNIINGKKVIVK